MALSDDVDAKLLPLFLEEADELRPEITLCLHALRAAPQDAVQLQLINRLLHTFKGSARMTGAMRIGDIIHIMEDRLFAEDRASGPGLWDALAGDMARINALLDELRGGVTLNNPDASASHSEPAAERTPFSSMSERLYRTLRQTAGELNKRVNLELIVDGVELERSMLEKMTAPFEHLLRNAIAHGLEDEQQRLSSGKNVVGEVQLSLRQKNGEVVIEFSDDGCGLNLAELQIQANKKGLLTGGALGEGELEQLIFIPGISTASKVTEVSGRGIGMDVVRSEIAAMGGEIHVSSTAGRGTQFTIRLPARVGEDA